MIKKLNLEIKLVCAVIIVLRILIGINLRKNVSVMENLNGGIIIVKKVVIILPNSEIKKVCAVIIVQKILNGVNPLVNVNAMESMRR